jgi:hypothetical protein
MLECAEGNIIHWSGLGDNDFHYHSAIHDPDALLWMASLYTKPCKNLGSAWNGKLGAFDLARIRKRFRKHTWKQFLFERLIMWGKIDHNPNLCSGGSIIKTFEVCLASVLCASLAHKTISHMSLTMRSLAFQSRF